MSLPDKLEKFIEYAYERGFFNGVWLLSENGAIVSEGALGVADITGRRLDKDSVFELASVSKQFTAGGIMILRDRGLLNLDDPITDYFPESSYDQSITIRNLLNHTSGLPDYMPWVMKKAIAEGTIPTTDIMEEFLSESGDPADFPPGEKWEYCNTGYALLAQIIKKVSGKSYGDFLKDEIFIPLGMENTTVYHRRLNRDQIIDNYAYGLIWDEGEYRYPDDTESRNYVIPLDGIEGDGTVNSNLHDMLLWDRALRNGSLLSPDTQKEMWQPTRLNDGLEKAYGFGWMLDMDRADGLSNVRHNGDWPGYSTMFLRFLDKDSTFIYMLNRTGQDDIAHSMTRDGMLETVLEKEAMLPERTENLKKEMPEAELSSISGIYEGGGQEASITRSDDGRPLVSLSIGGEKYSFEFVSAGKGIYYTIIGGIRFECDGYKVYKESIGTLIKRR